MTGKVNSQASDGFIITIIRKFLSGDLIWGMLRFIFMGGLAGILIIAAFFVNGLWRYLIAPLLAGWLAFMAGVLYLRDIYELDNFWQAFRYLFAAFFGRSQSTGDDGILVPQEGCVHQGVPPESQAYSCYS